MFFVFAYDAYEEDGARGGENDCELIADTLEEAMQWTPTRHWDTVGIYTVQDRQFVQIAEGEITTEYGAIIPEPELMHPYLWTPFSIAPRREQTYHVAWTPLPKEGPEPRVVEVDRKYFCEPALALAWDKLDHMVAQANDQVFGDAAQWISLPDTTEQNPPLSVWIHARPIGQPPDPPTVAFISPDGNTITLQWEGNATVTPPAQSPAVSITCPTCGETVTANDRINNRLVCWRCSTVVEE